MLEPNLTFNGLKVSPRNMTQLGIIKNLKNGMQHFTRMIPLRSDLR